MHARPLEKTLVCQLSPGRGRGRWLATTFPKSAMMILRAFKGDYMAWEDAGRLSRLVSSRRKTPGSRKIGSMNRITIPPPVIRRMRLSDKKLLQWYVTAGPGDKWEILAGVEKPAVPRKARMPKRRSGLFSRGVATTLFYPKLSVPRPVLNILGIPGRGHVRLAGSGPLLKIEQCRAADEGAMEIHSRMHDGSSGRFRTSFNIFVPPTMAGHFEMGARIRWYVATDGGGGWEIRVGAANG